MASPANDENRFGAEIASTPLKTSKFRPALFRVYGRGALFFRAPPSGAALTSALDDAETPRGPVACAAPRTSAAIRTHPVRPGPRGADATGNGGNRVSTVGHGPLLERPGKFVIPPVFHGNPPDDKRNNENQCDRQNRK